MATEMLAAKRRLNAEQVDHRDRETPPAELRDDARYVPAPLAIVLVLGLVVRLGLWAWLGTELPDTGDAKDYDTLAINLASHGEFALQPGQPISLRPPLYPLVLSGIYRLSENRAFQLAAVGVFQSLLSLCTAWIVYRIAAAAYSQRIGIGAAAWTCFYPSLLAYNRLVLTEVLFTFLLCGSILAFISALRQNSLATVAAAGVLLGLAALTRSLVWLFPVPLAGYFLLAWRDGFGRRMMAVLVMTSAFALTIAPWSFRNTQLQNTFVAVDVMGGRNLMMGNYEYTPLYRAWDAISVRGEQGWAAVLQPELAKANSRSQGHVDKVAMQYGLRFILAHPGLTLERSIIKFVNFWQLEREVVADAQQAGLGVRSHVALWCLALLIVGGYVAAAFAGIFGALLCPPTDWRIHGLLLLVIAYVCGLHSVVFGHSRYHLPLMPLVFVYAAAISAGAIWQQRRSARFCVATGLCTALCASWAWEFLWADPQRYVKAIL